MTRTINLSRKKWEKGEGGFDSCNNSKGESFKNIEKRFLETNKREKKKFKQRTTNQIIGYLASLAFVTLSSLSFIRFIIHFIIVE